MLRDCDLEYQKFFVTGVFASGKTTTALEISQLTGAPYRDFDRRWNYRKRDRIYAYNHLVSLGQRFVTDAIAFSAAPDPYFAFNEFYKTRSDDILIICTTCLNVHKWLERVYQKKTHPSEPQAIRNYIDFYKTAMPLHDDKVVLYYDTLRKCYVSLEEINSYIESIS